jgi:hypothetical protein
MLSSSSLTASSRRVHACLTLSSTLALVACSGRDSTTLLRSETSPSQPAPADGVAAEHGETPAGPAEHLYATSTIVFNTEGQNTYVSLLSSLEPQSVDLDQAREFSGWSGIWGHAGKLFVSDGESPTMTRFAVGDDGTLRDEGKLNFLNYGSQHADSAFVGPDKAYVFADEGIVWDASTLEITGSFALPVVADRPGGMEYGGLRSGRSLAVSGDRTYVAASWANWDDYAVSEDSLIVVIDSATDRVIDTLSVPCPYLDVGSVDDEGNVYFSNWVYSLGPTLLFDKRRACAVRIRAGADRIDDSWSLTFADVTDGREAAALRWVGDGKALISVYYDERITIDETTSPEEIADAANWRFWLLDVNTLEAEPIDDIDYNAGGFAVQRIDGRAFVMVPSEDYESTNVYELSSAGRAELHWSIVGWSTELFELR